MKQLNAGLVGFGKSAQIFHAPFIVNNPNFKLRSVVERHGESSKTKYPFVKVVRDIRGLLEDPEIDFVVITTPNSTHFEFARQSLLHNKHVIVEKPFTVTSTEADELISISREKQRILTVYQNRRLDGDFITVKKLLYEGELGDVVEFESHFDRYRPDQKANSWKEEPLPGSGIVYDLGSHLIDQALQLFGVPQSVKAEILTQRPGSSIDDYFRIILKYKGFNSILTAGMINKETDLRFRITGTKGTFIKNGLDPQENDMIAGKDPYGSDWGEEPEENYGTMTLNGLERRIRTTPGNYNFFYKNFYNAVMHTKEILVKPEEARLVIRIIELAYDR